MNGREFFVNFREAHMSIPVNLEGDVRFVHGGRSTIKSHLVRGNRLSKSQRPSPEAPPGFPARLSIKGVMHHTLPLRGAF